ncbi:hypothetical protein GIB67_015780 [Kingdonia uniflora]|uniref:Guanosine nucleotide diphosphate dissociation inhibitor n=1 Tax=Kingdonia uniflora TaxID=39325 RepID=A0A7J7NV87_9MAGN|nr:hypothetical protein GIB67_015780 [Kingdonia uniflora]
MPVKNLVRAISINENDMDSQQKDSIQQMMVSLPGPSCKINHKIALLGVLYGEKCKAAFDSVSKSVQTLQGLRHVLMGYLHRKQSDHNTVAPPKFAIPRSLNNCYSCATAFVQHMDMNDYYGGESTSLNLTQLWKRFRGNDKTLKELGSSKEYNVDTIPKFMIANGALLQILIHTDDTKYLNFKVVDGSFVYNKAKIHKVPATDVEALKSPLMGLFEKRRARKFFIYVQVYEDNDPKSHEGLDLTKVKARDVISYVYHIIYHFYWLLSPQVEYDTSGKVIGVMSVEETAKKIIFQACTPPKSDTPDKDQVALVLKTKDDNGASPINANASGVYNAGDVYTDYLSLYTEFSQTSQLERHENSILRQENDKLRAENMSIWDAMRTPIYNNCGGPVMLGEISLEVQQVRVENARLQDELNQVFGCNGLTSLSTVITSLPLGNDYGGVSSPLSAMHGELQVLLPLVPICEVNFLQFCKQYAEGVWTVVDVSVDMNRDTSNPQTFVSSRRLPSGCIVQDMPNGYSKKCEGWALHVLGCPATVVTIAGHPVNVSSAAAVVVLDLPRTRFGVDYSHFEPTLETISVQGLERFNRLERLLERDQVRRARHVLLT